jgi:hypothetical protein
VGEALLEASKSLVGGDRPFGDRVPTVAIQGAVTGIFAALLSEFGVFQSFPQG